MTTSLDKKNWLTLNKNITIFKENIEVAWNIKVLGVHIKSKLNFDIDTSIICKFRSNQLRALERLKKYLRLEQKSYLFWF